MAIRRMLYGVKGVEGEGLETVRGRDLRGLEPRQLRLEVEAQLRSLLLRQPIRHLRKDGAIEQNAPRLPWHLLRGARFGKNLVKISAHLIGIGAINRRRLILEEIILFVIAKKVGLSRGSHGRTVQRRIS